MDNGMFVWESQWVSHISISFILGHYSPPALVRLHELILINLRLEHGLLLDELGQRPLLAMVASHQEVHDSWREFSRYRGPTHEVYLSITVVEVGRSSVVCVSKVMAQDCNQPFVTLRFVLAAIDAITRQSSPFSDKFRAKLNPIVRHNMSSSLHLPDDVEVVPSVARLQGDLDLYIADHHVTTSVMPSDIDLNQHTNSSVYVRFAINAAHDALRQGRLKTFRGSLNSTCPKVMDIRFRSETISGDELDIYLWKDVKQARMLHARLYGNKRPVCYITFTYTDNLVAKL